MILLEKGSTKNNPKTQCNPNVKKGTTKRLVPSLKLTANAPENGGRVPKGN